MSFTGTQILLIFLNLVAFTKAFLALNYVHVTFYLIEIIICKTMLIGIDLCPKTGLL